MIHFELSFVKCESSVFSCIFFFFFPHVNIQLLQHHLLKRLTCSIILSLLLCQRTIDYLYGGLFLGSLFYWSSCLFFQQYHTVLITVASQWVLKLDNISPPTLFFSLNTVLSILGLLPLHINFRISLSVSGKK